MRAIFDFSPKNCPRCGGQLPSLPDVAETQPNAARKCASCGLQYIVGDHDTLLKVATYIAVSHKVDDFELIISTKLSSTTKGFKTRILDVGKYKELVLIIDPDASIEGIREELGELKTDAIEIVREFGRKPDLPKRIYFEYKILHPDYGWTNGLIAQQVIFDCIVALIMYTDKNTTKEMRDFGESFFGHLIRFTRKRSKDIDDLFKYAVHKIEAEELPWMPESYLLDEWKISDAFLAWKKETKGENINIDKKFVLASFWTQSIKNGYWDKAEALMQKNYIKLNIDDYYRHFLCLSEIKRMP